MLETDPTYYVVDDQGVIRFTHLGYHDDEPEAWEREIREILR